MQTSMLDTANHPRQISRHDLPIEEETIAQLPEGSDSLKPKKRQPASNQDLTEMINNAMGMPMPWEYLPYMLANYGMMFSLKSEMKLEKMEGSMSSLIPQTWQH